MQILDVIMRVLHILGAMTAVGGTIYVLTAFLGSLHLVDSDLKMRLLQLARERFNRVLHPAIGLLVLTGTYNWWRNAPIYNALKEIDKGQFIALQALLGLKVMLAMVVFVIVFMQGHEPMSNQPARWLKVNLVLSFLIVILAAVVRMLRLGAMTG